MQTKPEPVTVKTIQECKFADELKDGYCERRRFKGCDGNGEIDLDEPLKTIERCEMCSRQSLFGNSFFVLTKEDIESVLSGKILYSLGEYGVFIGLARALVDAERSGT